MTPPNPVLEMIRDVRGTAPRIAAACGLTRSAAWQWARLGRVPAEHVGTVEKLLGIPREQIRPDLYPEEHEQMGLDLERRLELIALLAQGAAWDAVVLIGQELLDAYYPADVFTGASEDIGPRYVVALRAVLKELAELEREAAKRAGPYL